VSRKVWKEYTACIHMANPEELGVIFHLSVSVDLKEYMTSHLEADELCGGKYEDEESPVNLTALA
jgi:hypothetical protein